MTFGGKDNRGPSIAELQRYIRDQIPLAFILNTGEQVIGKLRWFDENAYSVVPDGEQPFTILRSAVIGYRKYVGDPVKSTASTPAHKTIPAPVGATGNQENGGSAPADPLPDSAVEAGADDGDRP